MVTLAPKLPATTPRTELRHRSWSTIGFRSGCPRAESKTSSRVMMARTLTKLSRWRPMRTTWVSKERGVKCLCSPRQSPVTRAREHSAWASRPMTTSRIRSTGVSPSESRRWAASSTWRTTLGISISQLRIVQLTSQRVSKRNLMRSMTKTRKTASTILKKEKSLSKTAEIKLRSRIALIRSWKSHLSSRKYSIPST